MTLCIHAVSTKGLMRIGFLGGGGTTGNDLIFTPPSPSVRVEQGLPITPSLQSSSQDLGLKWKRGHRHIDEVGQSCSKANVEFESYRENVKILEDITSSLLKLLLVTVQCCLSVS